MSDGPMPASLLAQLEQFAAAAKRRSVHQVLAAERRSHLVLVPPVKPPDPPPTTESDVPARQAPRLVVSREPRRYWTENDR